MAELTMSGFIIGLLTVSLFFVGMGVFMTEINDKYPEDYDTETGSYNNLNELNTLSDKIHNSSKGLKTGIESVDKASQLIAGGFSTIIVAQESLDIFEKVQNQALSDASIGDSQISNAINGYITALVIVTIVFIGIAAIMKWYI